MRCMGAGRIMSLGEGETVMVNRGPSVPRPSLSPLFDEHSLCVASLLPS